MSSKVYILVGSSDLSSSFIYHGDVQHCFPIVTFAVCWCFSCIVQASWLEIMHGYEEEPSVTEHLCSDVMVPSLLHLGWASPVIPQWFSCGTLVLSRRYHGLAYPIYLLEITLRYTALTSSSWSRAAFYLHEFIPPLLFAIWVDPV